MKLIHSIIIKRKKRKKNIPMTVCQTMVKQIIH